MTSVGEIGESEVLRRVRAQLAPSDAAVVGPGDDAAVLRLDGELVVTTDTMIEGPDFRLAWHSGVELGRKLAATNLSDVAAMGARPIALTVAIACPQHTPVVLLEELARGLRNGCDELAPGCGVVGGDLGTAPVLTVAVTALGDLDGRTAVVRSGARPGDVIAYAGQLGLAGLGLSLLFQTGIDGEGNAHNRSLEALRAQHPDAITAQLTPRPPIGAGIEAAKHGATAMLDVSDGLALDAARIAEASDVVLALDSERLLRAFGVQGGQQVSIEAMLTGGEDHGMLATFGPQAKLPEGFHIIGRVQAPAAVTTVEGGERRATEPGVDAAAAADASRVLLDGAVFAPQGWDPYGRLPAGATIVQASTP